MALCMSVHYILTPEKASYQGIVKLIEVNEKRRHPKPTLHNLSGLQALIYKKKRYSPTDILNTFQSLYEKGYI
ncbi:DNA topoisomerase IA [Paenibacillus sp. DS2015]